MPEEKGQCLCGSVQVKVNRTHNHVDACHCGMCRRWGGGPFISIRCADQVVFSGEARISVYDSSEWAERGFCNQCGSHLFYHIKGSNEYEVPAGLFENQDGLKLDLQVYVDKKPSFYSFENKTKEMTEEDVIRQYCPEKNLKKPEKT
ncbi:MAG: GFA family protein [Pontibacterium sp.]